MEGLQGVSADVLEQGRLQAGLALSGHLPDTRVQRDVTDAFAQAREDSRGLQAPEHRAGTARQEPEPSEDPKQEDQNAAFQDDLEQWLASVKVHLEHWEQRWERKRKAPPDVRVLHAAHTHAEEIGGTKVLDALEQTHPVATDIKGLADTFRRTIRPWRQQWGRARQPQPGQTQRAADARLI